MNYIALRLDFPGIGQAQAFLEFLESRVWPVTANSPGLAGSPQARVFVEAPEQ